MNPDPAAVLAIVAVSVSCALAFIVLVSTISRLVLPWVEGWCARHESRFISALAISEDARLPYAAKQRARNLFLSKLDERQRRWHLRRRFDVLAPGGRRYTISPYRPFNIHTRDAVFCVQVDGCIPVYDKLLAQKLLVETDEQLFLSRANIRTFSRAWERRVAEARLTP